MSFTIAKFESASEGGTDLNLGGYWGGNRGGLSVQISLGDRYIGLNAYQTEALIRLLQKRLDGEFKQDMELVVTP